jgi:hypothetical protein
VVETRKICDPGLAWALMNESEQIFIINDNISCMKHEGLNAVKYSMILMSTKSGSNQAYKLTYGKQTLY